MNTVADPSADVLAMQPDWALAAALLGGTVSMRLAAETYLPRWPNEDTRAYQSRLATATLMPAYSRTIQTLTGKPFSKPITIGDDVPPTIVEMLANVDLEGRNLDTFAADVMESAMGFGLCGILVDYPTAENVQTMADERAQGLRPYWVHIKPEQIIGCRSYRNAGLWEIAQLRLLENICTPDGEFGELMVKQIRVLEPGRWRTFRENKKKEWVLYEQGTTTLDYVPFVPVYGERTGFMRAKPPLREMAHLNVQHWQSASDQQTILHVARVPILTVIGVDDDTWELNVGASASVRLPMGSSMNYVEHSGKAIDAGRLSITDLEETMRQAGAELLLLTKQRNVTATEIATDNAVAMCALQRIVQGLKDAINQALQMTADWIGEADGGRVKIFDDFATISPINTESQGLLAAVQVGLISKSTAISEMKRRGILSDTVNADTEAELISNEGPVMGLMHDTGEPAMPAMPAEPMEPMTEPAEPSEPAEPALDLCPLTDAIMALVGRMDAQMTQEANEPEDVDAPPMDLTALIAAINNRPESVVNMEAVIDATPIAKAVAEAIAAIPRQEAPIINMPPITVEQPSITINNPPAAPINIAQPAITIAAPSGNRSATMTKQADGSYVMQVQGSAA